MKCPVCDKNIKKGKSYCSTCGWSIVEDGTVYGSLFGPAQKKEYEERAKLYREIIRESSETKVQLENVKKKLEENAKVGVSTKASGTVTATKPAGEEKRSKAAAAKSLEEEKRSKAAEAGLLEEEKRRKSAEAKLLEEEKRRKAAEVKLLEEEKQRKTAETKLHEEEQKNTNLAKELKEVHKQLSEANSSLAEEKRDKANIKLTLARVEREKDTCKRDCDDAETEARGYRVQASEAQEKIRQLEKDKGDLQNRVNELVLEVDRYKLRAMNDAKKRREDEEKKKESDRKYKKQLTAYRSVSFILCGLLSTWLGMYAAGYQITDLPFPFFENTILNFVCSIGLLIFASLAVMISNYLVELFVRSKFSKLDQKLVIIVSSVTTLLFAVGVVVTYLPYFQK